jgi:cop protein
LGDKNKNLSKMLTKELVSGTLLTIPKEEKNMATNKKRVQVSFTDEQHQMLVDLAKSKGFSKSAIIVLALEEYLKTQK